MPSVCREKWRHIISKSSVEELVCVSVCLCVMWLLNQNSTAQEKKKLEPPTFNFFFFFVLLFSVFFGEGKEEEEARKDVMMMMKERKARACQILGRFNLHIMMAKSKGKEKQQDKKKKMYMFGRTWKKKSHGLHKNEILKISFFFFTSWSIRAVRAQKKKKKSNVNLMEE